MIRYFAIHLIVISIDNEKEDEFIKNCHLKTKNNIEGLLYNKMCSCVAQKSSRCVLK
jgi:hypothetical protein